MSETEAPMRGASTHTSPVAVGASGPTADAVPQVVISVCTSCRATGGEDLSVEERPGHRLLSGLRAAGLPAGVSVRPVECLSVCKRPCTVALTGPDRYTYVFGDLDPEQDVAALVVCAARFGETEHGFMLWRERPAALRRGIVARIPPLGWAPEDGWAPR